jgi:hypothetical protein
MSPDLWWAPYAIACVIAVAIVWAVALRAPKLPPRPSIPEPADNAWDYMARAATMVWKPTESLDGIRDELVWQQPEAWPPKGDPAPTWALGELRKGLHRPCRLPDGAEGSTGFLEATVGFRRLVWGLQAEISTLLAQGKADEAIGSARDILRLGRNLLCNGWGTGVFLAGALDHAGAHAMVQIVETGHPSADALREFVAWNEASRTPPQSLADTLLIDHYDSIAAMQARQAQHPPVTIRGRSCQAVASPFERIWLAGSARKLMEVIRQVSRPYPEWGPAAATKLAGNGLADLLTGPLYAVACAWANADTARIGLSVRCALEAYRIEQGRLPDTLHELQPDYIAELPEDPMSGNDFIYRVGDEFGDDGYLLYSVGLDGEDDGGLVWSMHEGRGDIVFGPRWETQSGRGAPEPTGDAGKPPEWLTSLRTPPPDHDAT